MLLLLLAAVITLTSTQTVVIRGTSAILLDATQRALTCVLMGSSATDLEYQWRIGGAIERSFSSNNKFVVISASVPDARSDYTCDVKVTKTGEMYSSSRASVRLKIPDLSVTFAQNRNNQEETAFTHVGSNVSYTCLTLVPFSLEDLTVSVGITGPTSFRGKHINLSGLKRDSRTFRRTLYFSPLSARDAGEYTCTVRVKPVTPNPLVTGGTKLLTQTITVIVPQLTMELEPVDEYLLVTEHTSLSCSAAVTLHDRPLSLNIKFTWLRFVESGPQQKLSPVLYTNSRVFDSATNSTLRVIPEKLGTHKYTCQVQLDVRPAPDVIMEERSITLKVIESFDALFETTNTTEYNVITTATDPAGLNPFRVVLSLVALIGFAFVMILALCIIIVTLVLRRCTKCKGLVKNTSFHSAISLPTRTTCTISEFLHEADEGEWEVPLEEQVSEIEIRNISFNKREGNDVSEMEIEISCDKRAAMELERLSSKQVHS